MMTRFLNVRGRNFLGYGNSGVEYTFENGFTRIVGENGAGKSTVIDLLSWVYYGKTIRKMKQTSIINRTIDKDCYGESEFIANDGFKYKVERGMKPEIFKIYRADENGDYGQPLSKSAAKKDYQAELDSILGQSFDMFKQIIIFSVTRTNEKFLDMSAQKKRDVVANIFGLSLIDQVLKVIKKQYSDVKVSKQIANESSRVLTNSISRIDAQINSINDSSESRSLSEESIARDSIKQELKKLETSLKKFEKAKEKLQTKFELLDVDTLMKEQKQLEQEIFLLKSESSRLNKQGLEFLNLGAKCSSCGQVIDEEHKKLELSRIKREIESVKLSIAESEQKLEPITKSIGDAMQVSNDVSTATKRISEITKQQQEYQKQLIELTQSIATKSDNVSTSLLMTELFNLKVEYDLVCEKLNDIMAQEELYNILIDDALSDKGIKNFYIQQFVPILNEKVNEYFIKFNLPFSFVFDDKFEYKLYSTLNNGREFEYSQCSEGQQRKVDLAINFSFNSVMSSITNWNCNILIFDELLDSGVDAKSMKSIMNDIRSVWYAGGQSQEIVIISHKMEDDYTFHRSFMAEQDDNGFSKLTQMKQ